MNTQEENVKFTRIVYKQYLESIKDTLTEEEYDTAKKLLNNQIERLCELEYEDLTNIVPDISDFLAKLITEKKENEKGE